MRKEVLLDEKSLIGIILLEHGLEDGRGEGFQERIGSDPALKPNSWAYNFAEVSGLNRERSQTWGFCLDFLNQKEGGVPFYQVLLRSPLQCTVTNWRNCKRLREFEEIEVSRQRSRGDCKYQEETLRTFVWISSKNFASAQGFYHLTVDKETRAISYSTTPE